MDEMAASSSRSRATWAFVSATAFSADFSVDLAALQFFGFDFNLSDADVSESALNSQTPDIHQVKIYRARIDCFHHIQFSQLHNLKLSK